MFTAAQFTIAKCWKQPKCPSVNEWIKKSWYISYNGILHSRENEGIPTLSDSMDRTGERYAKWNKPACERQIPYGLTYKRNLMNKKEPQTRKHGTDWQRPEGREIQLERREGTSQRTCMHGPWTWTTVCGMTVGAGVELGGGQRGKTGTTAIE